MFLSLCLSIYPGLSPEQAADNPELAKKIAAEQETLDGLRARMDAFPKKEGTMYCARLHNSTAHTRTCDASCVPYPVCADITKEKAEVCENLLAAYMKVAMTAEERAEVEQAAAAKKAAADAEKQAAADAKNAEAVAAKAVAAKAAKAAEAEEKKAKAAEVAAEKKVAAEAKKVAAVEAAAAKKAKAAEEKQRKADEAAAKKAAKAAKPVR